MGVWGSGLYSSDFALDLRSSVRAALRLPFEGDRIVELLCALEPASANDPNDEDHSTFWLVMADQFARYGVRSNIVREKALQIIDGGTDIAMLKRLGMDDAGLRKREHVLSDLRQLLSTPTLAVKPRSVLKEPQALIFTVGDVLLYPTSLGRCRLKLAARLHPVPAWTQDAWGAAIILQSGLAFGFLAWYLPLVLDSSIKEKPDLARIRTDRGWSLRRPGTCSSADAKSLGFEKIGSVSLHDEKLKRAFPGTKSGTRAAIENLPMSRDLAAVHHASEAYVVRTAFPDTPEGEEKFQKTVRQVEESQAKTAPHFHASQSRQATQNPTISSLDEILS